MESGRTWNDYAGIAGGLVWMHAIQEIWMQVAGML